MTFKDSRAIAAPGGCRQTWIRAHRDAAGDGILITDHSRDGKTRGQGFAKNNHVGRWIRDRRRIIACAPKARFGFVRNHQTDCVANFTYIARYPAGNDNAGFLESVR